MVWLSGLTFFCFFSLYVGDILEAFEKWRHREPLPADGANKVSRPQSLLNLNLGIFLLFNWCLIHMYGLGQIDLLLL